MVTGVPLAVTSANIALFTKKNENTLSDSLLYLASGKRINQPSDGIPDYFYSERLSRSSRDAEHVLRSIEDAQAFMEIASSVGESVFNALTEMRELVKMYYMESSDEDKKNAYAAEFNALKETVSRVIQKSTYDGMVVVSDNGGDPFKQILFDNQQSDTALSILYESGDITDVSPLTIGVTDEATEYGEVEEELSKAGSYLAKTAAYYRGLNAHYTLVSNKIATENANAQRIVEVSTGEEYVNAMNKSIRNQASLAMLAQSNMYRTAIVKLFE